MFNSCVCSTTNAWIKLPSAPKEKEKQIATDLVDTVISLGDSSLVATKRALEGHILVWDLAAALVQHKNKKQKTITVVEGRFLKWSDSDNYYMGLGWDNSKYSTVH